MPDLIPTSPVDAVLVSLVAAVVLRWAIFLGLAAVDWGIQRRGGPDPADVVPLTVVVPAWNEAAVIARTLQSLLHSDLPELSVIVVDDGSTDATAAIVGRFAADHAQIRLLEQPVNGGKSVALNAGLQLAQTELVATLDADTLVDPACLRWLVATQRQTGADAVAANVRVGNRRSLLSRWQSLEYVAGLNLDRRAQNRLGVITTVPGAAALWRRGAVIGCGGFSSDTLAEDTDLSVSLLRTGGLLVFQDRALAYTEAPVTPVALWRQRRRWLSGNLGCIHKHGLGAGAPLRVRLLGLPNLWFAHVGVYLLPLVISGWVSLGRGGVAIPALATFGLAALVLDLVGLIGFYVADRADLRDLWHAPLQRLVFPSFLWGVFWSVVVTAPRSWVKIERRNTALLG